MIKSFVRASVNAIQTIRYSYHRDPEDLPREYGFQWTKEEKKMLFGKRIRPKVQMNYYDPIQLPGSNTQQIVALYKQFFQRNDLPISAQNVALLIYEFTTKKLMSAKAFDKIEQYVYKNKGQFRTRAIFGGLYGAIIHNRTNMINFFLEEYKASNKKFHKEEFFELLEACIQNKHLTLQSRQQFWEKHLKEDFKDGLEQVQVRNLNLVFRYYQAFIQIQEFDEQIWDKVISLMQNKRGWIRIKLMEKLYAVSGTFERAKESFEKYYADLSVDDQVLRRYNFEQMRLYTPKELFEIADANQNDFYPKNYTLVPEDQDADEWNREYEAWLQKGSIKKEQEIIKDKSMSFGYVIKDRFESMKQDQIDISNLSKQEFKDLFGSYEIAEEEVKKFNPDQEEESSPEEQGGQEQGKQGNNNNDENS